MATDIAEVTHALVAALPELSPQEQRLARSIYRVLAQGSPASPAPIAEAAGWSPEAVEQRLEDWPAVFHDRRGEVVGFWGFAVEELSGHRIDLGELGGGWTWCAYDTLFIAHLLDVTATVTSRCPTTGRQVRLRVSRAGISEVHPGEAVMSMLTPDGPIDDTVRESLCHFIHFFVSPAAAESWIRDHPGTFPMTLDDAFATARNQNAALYPTLVGQTG